MTSPDAPPIPARIGRYEILLPIASGGMGTVFLARQRGLGGFEREIALKLTHAHLREQPGWATELVEEAKLAARIRHPNVVQVLDVGDDPSGVFLVMQYVEGDTLAGLMRRALAEETRVPDAIGLRILDDALAGLHAAHELQDESGALVNLVHRDFSPQNVLVGVDGVALLTDFGVAKAAGRAGFTVSGTIKGKFGYMSPEQVRDRPLDRRSDVWAAGVVAWEVLVGRRLYPSGDQAATLFRIVTEDAPRLCSVRPDLPAALEDAIASALTRDTNARCPTVEELRQRIREAWAPRGPLAERAEVATYVRSVARTELGEQRLRAEEARSAVTRSAPTPMAGDTEPQTGASVVSDDTRKRVAQRSRMGWPAATLTMGVVAGALWLVGRARPTPEPPAPVPAVQPSPSAAASAASPIEPTPAPAVDVVPLSTAALSASPAVSSVGHRAIRTPRTPRGPATSTAGRSGTVGTAAVAPTSSAPPRAPAAPELLNNPYE